MLELEYAHSRMGNRIRIRRTVRIARQEPFELKVGSPASVVCWGVMPSGCSGIRSFSVGVEDDPTAMRAWPKTRGKNGHRNLCY